MKEYYKEIIDWSMVKEGDPIEVDRQIEKYLAYFVRYDGSSDVYYKTSTNVGERNRYKDYCRPLDKSCIKLEIDWSKVPVDTKVILNYDGKTENAHFSHIDDRGRIHTFNNGKTSWTSNGDGAGWLHSHEVELVDIENVTTL